MVEEVTVQLSSSPRDAKDDNDARPARHPGQQKFSIDHFVYPQIDSFGQNWGWDLIEINQIKDPNGRDSWSA